jgi:hypothetical protein
VLHGTSFADNPDVADAARCRISTGERASDGEADMDARDQSMPAARYQGRREMHNLAHAAVSALEQAGMKDTLHALQTRLFDRNNDELCDIQAITSGVFRCRYKPMVELLLLEVVAVMKHRDLGAEDQRSRILWALTMAGF